jgi:hypothetical protein
VKEHLKLSNHGQTFDLARKFSRSLLARDLSISVALVDFVPEVYPHGKWHRITARMPNGHMRLEDVTPLEVKAEIVTFLTEIEEEITAARVSEIERLARILVLQRGDK